MRRCSSAQPTSNGREQSRGARAEGRSASQGKQGAGQAAWRHGVHGTRKGAATGARCAGRGDLGCWAAFVLQPG